MSPKDAKQLKDAIRRLVRAEVADSWKGAGDPDDIPLIKEDLRRAKVRVLALLARMTRPTPESSPESMTQFQELTTPLIKYLCENHHPHTHIIITPSTAEIAEGIRAYTDESFIRD